MCTIERWEPTFLYPGRPPHELIALIILNTPITDTATFRQIWFKASYRVCADGGANRLLAASEAMRQSFVPDLIKGDLDSIRPDIKRHFEQLGVPIVEDPDQYATDLGKCVKAVAEQDAAKRTEHVIVILGGLQGRLDQTMHTLHAITKLAKTRKRVWVVSEESLACVLDKGEHELVIDQHILGPTCGLLPIGTDSALVTTKGLEWNLSDTETSMSTMVSTSNHIVSDLVQVTTNRLIVWTCAILAS
ncbi:hypothetical protein E5Q_02387 [Mixia osmundae IAM 14324]|uniref:Thiamine pyrophosphokinase n=1 Tax=Mixia osmundae (strain CBS 9802 / IAM 14324 / JCM 22182 / KY 12970) TaxID=764103 RepID=G7DYS0_MIXOS|nr:hypothetical protein E5Q_02387 [Mixia osmundae IAM 14324]